MEGTLQLALTRLYFFKPVPSSCGRIFCPFPSQRVSTSSDIIENCVIYAMMTELLPLLAADSRDFSTCWKPLATHSDESISDLFNYYYYYTHTHYFYESRKVIQT